MKKKLNKRKMVPNSIVSTDSKELRKPFWHDDTVDRLNKIYLVSCFAKKYPKFIYLLHLPTMSIHRTTSEQERIGRKYIQQIRNLEKDAIQEQEQQEDKLEQQEDELKEDKELNEDDEELDEDDDELNEDLLIKKFLF
ncbi:hypothetical protein C9374_013916 [Naegleria lovaniensis]|uniref:Uncharacterized protein n=1 Tax=Naegleria lovaniensis TaxID=51637 RepID=A0AA88GVT7_NAELO|nr:uncharacterized protein C9374_013916 [Naegleria lovaniensis]KAG2389356.1 hypothetical protein C9374_013916 [Naegleria lovaniensis]